MFSSQVKTIDLSIKKVENKLERLKDMLFCNYDPLKKLLGRYSVYKWRTNWQNQIIPIWNGIHIHVCRCLMKLCV